MSQMFFELKQTAQYILEELTHLGQLSSGFSTRSGIMCKPGCGACCAKPLGVWATPAEMLPMAWQLFEEGQTSESLRLLADSKAKDVCLVYEATDPSGQQGRCGRYKFRPTVCILFGSGMRPKKMTGHEFMGCNWQHRHFAQEIHAVESGSSGEAYDSRALTAKIRSISPDPKLAMEAPVNEALITALEMIEFNDQFVTLK